MRVDVLLVTVTEIETRTLLGLVREKYGREPKPKHWGSQTYYDLGEIGGARAFLVRCKTKGSSGKGGSSQTITQSIIDLSPSAIVMVGIAFGFRPDKHKIGHILVSEQIRPYELQRVGTAQKLLFAVLRKKRDIILRSDRPSTPIRMLDRFQDGALTWQEAEVQFGLILSGDKLVDNIDYRTELLQLEPEALGGEMEAAGLYDAADSRKVDWIVVKAICDWADGKKRENKKENQAQAARNAALFTLHVLEQGGFAPSSHASEPEKPSEEPGSEYAERRSILVEVAALRQLQRQPEEATRKYLELRHRTKTDPDWKDGVVITSIEDTFWTFANDFDFIDLTAAFFGKHEDENALHCSQFVAKEWQDDVQPLIVALDCAQKLRQSTDPLLPKEVEGVGPSLMRIQRMFVGEPHDRATELAKELLERQDLDPERKMAFVVSPKDLRWLQPWPRPRPSDDAMIARWLQTVGLTFNPFDPEAPEIDPYLRNYRVDGPVVAAKAKKPTLVFGAPGSGKTAATLLIALDCVDPPGRPREPGVLPVLWKLSIEIDPGNAQLTHLQAIAEATAETLMHYFAHRGGEFLHIPKSTKHNVACLLSLQADSPEHLLAELQRIGPEEGPNRDFLRIVKALYQQPPIRGFTERKYLELLNGSRPAGLSYTYLLTDLPSIPAGVPPPEMIQFLRSLLDLTTPLFKSGVLLKLFLPDDLLDSLGDLSAYYWVRLSWSRQDLADMLSARIRSAGGESLAALCGPDVPSWPSPDERLVEAAQGSPRQLVRLGNELLQRGALLRRPEDPLLSAADIDAVLGSLSGLDIKGG